MDGTLECNAFGLTITTDTGQSINLPYARLQIQCDAASPRQVCFIHPDFPETAVVTEDVLILMEPGIQERTALKRQIRDVRIQLPKDNPGHPGRFDSLKLTLKWCAVLGVLAVMVILGIQMLLSAAMGLVTPQMESRLGEAALNDFLSKYEEVEPERGKWAIDIASRLIDSIPHNKYEFQITFISTNDPNALAFPGGHVVITTGLLDMVGEDADRLAGVIAHEAAHVINRHSLRQMVNNAGPALAIQLLLGGDSGIAGILTSGSIYLSRLQYSRQMELEADRKALEYLRQSEFNPDGLRGFLIQLKAVSARYKSPPELLSTHPATDNRIEKLDQLLR